MESVPIQYLHLETAVFPLFLAMVLLVQLARSTKPGYYVQNVRHQIFWLLFGFVLLTLAFVSLLAHVSALLAVELAAGIILSLLHPVNALCLFIHLL